MIRKTWEKTKAGKLAPVRPSGASHPDQPELPETAADQGLPQFRAAAALLS